MARKEVERSGLGNVGSMGGGSQGSLELTTFRYLNGAVGSRSPWGHQEAWVLGKWWGVGNAGIPQASLGSLGWVED